MKKLEINTIVNEYECIDELNQQSKELLLIAQAETNKAYAPYSEFHVGAALRLANGEIVVGNNQENVAYPSGLCAERVAIYSAGAQFPDVPIVELAITAKTKNFSVDRPIAPCGACRQAVAEYEMRHDNKINILLMGEKGKVHEVKSMTSLLPLLFNEEGLKK